MLRAASVTKSLESVNIVSTRTFTNISQAHRDAIAKLGEVFQQKNASMRLYKREQNGAIPPFLYGERPYSEDLIYDTEGGGFLKDIGSSGSRERDDIDF